MEEQFETDPELNKLEQQHAAKLAAKEDETIEEESEDEYTFVSDATYELLEESSTLHRNTAILLEYLSNPDFCKGLTKRERVIVDKHSIKIWEMVIKLDKTVAELRAQEEDEDE